MKHIVAIPMLNNRVAPCFEVSEFLEIIEVENAEVINKRMVNCEGIDGFRRIRQLEIYSIDTLICNGIKEFYLNLLLASGITVYSRVASSVADAIGAFIGKKLSPVKVNVDKQSESYEIPHDELILWAKDLFLKGGYEVVDGPGGDFFLIDLVAKVDCPICAKPINVAICCGAHTYRIDQEVCEFHHLTKGKYNARVYVYPDSADVFKRCSEYGIEMISPDSKCVEDYSPKHSKIPILKGEIEGHERISTRTK